MLTSEIHKYKWSSEDDRQIIELHDQGLSWKAVADRINRTAQIKRTGSGCSGRYKRLVPKGQRTLVKNCGLRWTADEEAHLDELLRQRARPKEIAAILGKPVRAVNNKIQYKRDPRRTSHVEHQMRIWVPPHLVEDRDRRARAERNLTALLCGDPAPGQSALDKRQGAFA